MAAGRDTNYHFSQLTAGAPADVMGALGKALLAVATQRQGASTDAPALLRQAWLKLAGWLIRDAGAELNPQQQAFLLGGAVADSVAVKHPTGDVELVELLPTETYEGLLARLDDDGVSYLLDPLRRMAILALQQLAPLDLSRPGRYREPDDSAERGIDPAQLAGQLRASLQELEAAQLSLSAVVRELTDVVHAERLKPVLQAAGDLSKTAERVLNQARDPARIAVCDVPGEVDRHPALVAARALSESAGQILERLVEGERSLLSRLRQVKVTAAAVIKAGEASTGEAGLRPVVVLNQQATRLVVGDYNSLNTIVTQQLINSPQRTAWSASRVLLAEHTEKYEDPLAQCYATPAALAASIAKIDALHPNCFPHDAAGSALLPPVVIEPGVDFVQWYDDRFVIGFVCTEDARKGSKLSLSPLDSAVLMLYGQFLARGELYTYRGERASGNFAADYAGEVRSKAKVKFTGEKKKMTIVSASEIKDAARREEAVRDYMDFIFHTFNGLALPKRITPRRVGVLLKYCVIGDVRRTALLVLKHVVSHDLPLAREILGNLGGNDNAEIVGLMRYAIEQDPQIASRYHRDLKRVLADVMGPEFADSSARKGLLEARATSEAQAAEPAAEEPPAAEHDYFDI